MASDRRRQIEELFEAALERSGGERSAFLDVACGSDAELRDEVEALIAGHEHSEGALERPVAGLAASLLADRVHDRHIGPYRVVRELGRGGMGVVYLAERDDGEFRRRVAIKLVRSELDDGQIQRRLRAERQILASLSHPNIAQLLEGGVTAGQLPYLVLEYVDGLPITTHCDRHRLDIPARLHLFREACAAVHHAHQNLVIHRDLKPSNIVVDESGRVKLLDFGIAKLLNPALGPADAPHTRGAQWVMTPEYASPEQVRGEALTTASDVYSLGVVLYELLSGHRPYRLTTHSPKQILELVCDRDPERPSTRVGGIETVTHEDGTTEEITPAQISATRGLSAERLRRQLRGDLDGIVMMALRKEPRRRYGSAEMLSQDIRRHLEGLPVLAHGGSRSYRVRKFVRRHLVEVVAAALVVVSLVAGTGVASWQATVAGRERDRAAGAQAQAEKVTEFLMELFEAGDSDSSASAGEITARDLLRRGIASADEISDQPAVQARMLDVIGQIHHRLGQYDDAQALLERAVAIRRAVLGPASLDLAKSLIHLSWVHRSRADFERARPLVMEALEIRRRALPGSHPDLADAVYELGWLARGAEQERLYREALNILQRTNSHPERQVRLLQGISTNVRRQGRLLEALETGRAALRLAEREFGPDHDETGYAMIHLADHVLAVQQDIPGAERLYRRGLELLARRFGESHVRLVHGLHGLGALKSSLGEHAEAEELYREALSIRIAAIGPDHPIIAAQLASIAREVERQGHLEEAETLARDALDRHQRALGPRHPSTTPIMARLASILFHQGRQEDADRLYQETISIRSSADVLHAARLGGIGREYGRMLIQASHYERAEKELLRSLDLLHQAYGNAAHPDVEETRRALMELYEAWGRPELVERYRVAPGRFVPY